MQFASSDVRQADADFDNNWVCNKGFLHFIQNVIIG